MLCYFQVYNDMMVYAFLCCCLYTNPVPQFSVSMDFSLPDSSVHDFPGQITGVGCHFPLPGIFPTQESRPDFLHWQVGSLLLRAHEALS